MLARLLFYPTLTYNVVLEKLSCRQWYNRIDETVLLGALPFRSMTNKLVAEEGVRGVVSMNEDYELKYFTNASEEWFDVGVSWQQLSTVDLVATPTQAQMHAGVAFIAEHALKGNSVYVHCKAGRTRSATLVACYLMKSLQRGWAMFGFQSEHLKCVDGGGNMSELSLQKHSWTPQEAVNFITSKRPHILLRTPQWQTIKTFHADISRQTRTS